MLSGPRPTVGRFKPHLPLVFLLQPELAISRATHFGGTAMTACIVGWSHTPFGKLSNETVESLIIKAANEALDHAGIGPEDVDEIMLGHFNAGFTEQDFTASIVLQANDAFRFKPATRVENACATGTAAVREAIKTVEANRAKITLVVGVEQMTHAPNPDIARSLLKASYLAEDGETPGGFAGE